MKENLSQAYDKYYKIILVLPIALLLISLGYLANFYFVNGDIMKKDVSLTGGTSVTIYDEKINVADLEKVLSEKLNDPSITKLSDITTGKTVGVTIETQSGENDTVTIIENYLGYKLDSKNSDIEFSGSTLSSGFYFQLLQSILLAFVLMSFVVFFLFGTSNQTKAFAAILSFAAAKLTFPNVSVISVSSIILCFAAIVAAFYFSKSKKEYIISAILTILAIFVFFFSSYYLMIIIIPILIIIYISYSIPSMAVISCAFADIVMTLFFVDLIGLKVSTAGIIAFLMLIGYSVDSDMLLTTRLTKRSTGFGSNNSRIFGAFKTGMTMTLTSIAAVVIGYLISRSFSDVLSQIFLILAIGLILDIFNTWITNASLLKWYVEHKEKNNSSEVIQNAS